MRRAVRLFLLMGAIGLLSYSRAVVSFGHGRWTELNIGPFYIDTDSDTGAARDALTQLEQVRWVLGGLLESQDLQSVWPFRVVLTNSAKTNPRAASGEFVWQNGIYFLPCPPGAPMPVGQVAGILLDANTPRLPAEVESGLRALFDTLEAKGSRVTWGGAPAHPDLAWARMQLFATKFEYSSSFHIFVAALKSGSTVASAERNAFGKEAAALEQEAAANLASGHWETVSVSGRPLDPKRDFGEHSLEDSVADIYMADAEIASRPDEAEATYKKAVEVGGVTRALGYEGLATLAKQQKGNPKPFLEDAERAGSRSASVYVAVAAELPGDDALPLLKKAAQLNPLWAEPVYRQAQLTQDATAKEALLKKAVQLDARVTRYWIDLANVETERGETTAAEGAWLRAENSAATEVERERVHELRVSSEQERLDAADEARRRERDAAQLSDERAQQSEEDRIRAAEEKANAANDEAANGHKPENVVPWNSVVPRKNFEGMLERVDCLGSSDRLVVKDRTGATVQLVLSDPSQAGLACGVQKPVRPVRLTYAAQPDDRFHASGIVLTMQVK